jgi:hypothetical protein
VNCSKANYILINTLIEGELTSLTIPTPTTLTYIMSLVLLVSILATCFQLVESINYFTLLLKFT